MKLLLLIIKFIFIRSCFDSCDGCDEPSTEENMKCERCPSNYYQLVLEDGSINCYNESNIKDGYFLDKSEVIYKIEKCHVSCKKCNGKKENEDTNCKSCNNGYYPLIDQPSFCKKRPQDANFLKGYYYDASEHNFKKCYKTCKECDEGGDSKSHKCTICKDDYFKNGTDCFEDCPEGLFKKDKECVTTCGPGYYSDLFKKVCTNNCTTGSTPNDALGICTIEGTSNYKNYDCENIITENIKPKMKFFISSKSLIRGKNCYIQVYNSLDQQAIHNYAEKYMISKLFLRRDFINPNIIVVKIDYNQTYKLNPEVNDIKFILYTKDEDDNYSQITNLDLVTPIEGNDLIYIQKPFINIDNIKQYRNKFEIFDIFNARHKVYNELCEQFTSEYNTDITYDYRREAYFYNLSLYCLNDSTIYYSSFISKSISVECKANYIGNEFTNGKIGDSRFKIFKCKKYFGKNLGTNEGFWIIFMFILFNLGLSIPFLITGFKNIVSFMGVFERTYNKPTGLKLKWTVLNPPKKNIKVIYKPKEFILSDDFFEEENELKLKYDLFKKLKNKKRRKINENEKDTNIGKPKNQTVIEVKTSKNNMLSSINNSNNNDTSSNKNDNSNGNQNISYDNKISKSSSNGLSNDTFNNNYSDSEEKRKEEEKKEKEKRRIENQKFKEELSLKQKKKNAKRKYQSYIMPQPEIKSIIKDYSKKQNEILENKQLDNNVLKLDKNGNVIKNLPTDNLNMKYEPKQYLNQYMFHNFDHLLPVPKSEQVSSGSLSSDIRNELMKLQQLREKQMVERIFFKKIIANQKLLKGYNEDFYPFSFDECIYRRKEKITYKIIFWNYLREANLIVNVFFDENFLECRYLKIYLLGFSIYLMLFFNLLLYSDNYINDFYIHKGNYNFFYQITKSLYSCFITCILVKSASFLISSKIRLRNIIIKRKFERDKEYIRDYKKILFILTIKVSVFFSILIFFLFFGLYYFVLFAKCYKHSTNFVIVGTIFSAMFYELFSIGIIALASGFKYSAISSQSRGLYEFMSYVNLVI